MKKMNQSNMREREREREDGSGGKAVLAGVVMNGLIVALIS